MPSARLNLSALTLVMLSALLLLAARPAQAQTETVLYDFCSQPNCSDGTGPQSGLAFDSAGNLYGMAGGGSYGWGEVFELSPTGTSWTETVLFSFANNGVSPVYPI